MIINSNILTPTCIVFGDGDIGISQGTATLHETPMKGLYLRNIEPKEIGSYLENENPGKPNAVIMFKNLESLEVVIQALEDIKFAFKSGLENYMYHCRECQKPIANAHMKLCNDCF